MRFPVLFTRRKGAGEGAALGSDAAPTGHPKARAMPDNVASLQHFATAHPAKSIAIAYRPPSGNVALPCTAYVYDETSGAWFAVGSANLAANAITTIEIPTLVERAPLPHELGGPPAHHHVVALVVTDPGTAPDGVHTLAVGLAV